MIPRLQMSTFRPYSLRVTTSGAIQYGVPAIVVRLLCDSLICAQKPKSVSLILPFPDDLIESADFLLESLLSVALLSPRTPPPWHTITTSDHKGLENRRRRP